MSRRTKMAAWFVLGSAAMALFIAVLYALLQGAQTTQSIRDTQLNSHALLHTIDDCTQPSGRCYQRGQRQTASAVASINRVVILAAACSVGVPAHLSVANRQTLIQSCVIDRLATHSH